MLAQMYLANITIPHIKEMLSKCEACARRKPVQPHGPLKSEVPDEPWGTVAMDFCGPYPESGGYKYVLVFVDQFTKWVELVPTANQDTLTVIRAMYEHIICRHGCPRRLLSDNGPSFRSKLLDKLCVHFGIKKVFSTAYYPQGDGYAERFMRTLNNSLSALTQHTGADWHQYLPGIAFGYNITDHRAIGTSPFELTHGRIPHLPGGGEESTEAHVPGEAYVKRLSQIIQDATARARAELTKYYDRMRRQYDKSAKEKDVNIGDWVLIRLSDYERDKYPSVKLAPRWSEPQRVVELAKDKAWCKVAGYKSGATEHVNVNRVLPMGKDAWLPRQERPEDLLISDPEEAETQRRRDSCSSDGSGVTIILGPTASAPARQPSSEPSGVPEARPQPTCSPTTGPSRERSIPLTRPTEQGTGRLRQRSAEGRGRSEQPLIPQRILAYRQKDAHYQGRWKDRPWKDNSWVSKEALSQQCPQMVQAYDELWAYDRAERGVRPVGRPRKRALAYMRFIGRKQRRHV